MSKIRDMLTKHNVTIPEKQAVGFYDYLDSVKKEPWVTRNPFQLLLDMMMSSKVTHKIVTGKLQPGTKISAGHGTGITAS